MIKLSDIIKSGGGNAKINRFINRYVLSKKEKKDIVNEIKEGGGSSISENKKYFKAIKTYGGEIDQCMGAVPFYRIFNEREFTYTTENNIEDFDATELLKTNEIPYYIIDFNSKSVRAIKFRDSIPMVCRLNNYPYEAFKNIAIESGIQMDEEQLNQQYNQIKEAFDSTFVEITKEEWLRIHEKCLALQWVPEWY